MNYLLIHITIYPTKKQKGKLKMSYGSTQNNATTLNNRLLNTRAKHNHSQKFAGELMGLSLFTLLKIEKGRFDNVYETTRRKILAYLDAYENKESSETINTLEDIVKQKITTNTKTITTPWGTLNVPKNCKITFELN